MALDIWLRTTQIAREETCCCHYMGYSFQLTAMVLFLYRQDTAYHAFVTPVMEHWLEQEIAEWVHPEGLIQQPIAS